MSVNDIGPVYDLLRQAGAALREQEDELHRAHEERDLAQQLLIEQSNHHDQKACTERGWK
jgi:hypothetical protein